MNDVFIVNVLHRVEQLAHEVRCFGLGQALAPFDHFVQALVVTQFEEDVAVVAIFKKVLVLAHVLVFERSMDLDFCLQLREKQKNERDGRRKNEHVL